MVNEGVGFYIDLADHSFHANPPAGVDYDAFTDTPLATEMGAVKGVNSTVDEGFVTAVLRRITGDPDALVEGTAAHTFSTRVNEVIAAKFQSGSTTSITIAQLADVMTEVGNRIGWGSALVENAILAQIGGGDVAKGMGAVTAELVHALGGGIGEYPQLDAGTLVPDGQILTPAGTPLVPGDAGAWVTR